jgi:hypothetical protein
VQRAAVKRMRRGRLEPFIYMCTCVERTEVGDALCAYGYGFYLANSR